MILFKNEKDSDKELIERSERLGVDMGVLLDFHIKTLWRKTLNKILNAVLLFCILSYFKEYLNYKIKIIRINMLVGIYSSISKNNLEKIWEKVVVVVKSDNID